VLALWDRLADEAGRDPASNQISFLRDWGWTLPTVVVLLLIWFFVTGFSNAVNLTDGLDGLATGASALVFSAYVVVGIWQANQTCGVTLNSKCYDVRDPLDLAVVAASIAGACIGFLWWNASPAQIFMGDTGSLALGAALAGLAILSRTELLLVVLGGLFVVETLSVMLQVGFFKVSRGRRIFKMAPIHHHFEMLGWEQITVVIRFWVITGLCVAAGVGIFYAEWVTGN
jgi:phospho-N-acetylmuramoyl-pentapeptide-transferase